jgi:hypothetical protein
MVLPHGHSRVDADQALMRILMQLVSNMLNAGNAPRQPLQMQTGICVVKRHRKSQKRNEIAASPPK